MTIRSATTLWLRKAVALDCDEQFAAVKRNGLSSGIDASSHTRLRGSLRVAFTIARQWSFAAFDE